MVKKLLKKWIVAALSIMFIAWLFSGIDVKSFPVALLVAFVIGAINTIVKPVLMFITLPINILTLGIFSLVLNALLLMLAGNLVDGFIVLGFWNAFWGAITLSITNTILDSI